MQLASVTATLDLSEYLRHALVFPTIVGLRRGKRLLHLKPDHLVFMKHPPTLAWLPSPERVVAVGVAPVAVGFDQAKVSA